MAAKKLYPKNFAELLKRVPPNQIKQFEAFREKSLKFYRSINKYRDSLPAIDWEYYRNNVRKDYVPMVEEFQLKYEELNHNFARRYEALDHSKYYAEWEQLTAEVKEEIKEFIEDSNRRIEIYQAEIKRLENLSYEDMTIEQYMELRPEAANFIPGQAKPLFWPHTPEEQLSHGDVVGKVEENEDKHLKSQNELKSE